MGEAAPLASVIALDRHEGNRVELRGWVYKTRAKGKLCFLHVRDGTGIVQTILAKGNVPDEAFDHAGKAAIESSIVVRGLVKKDARAPGGFELDLDHAEIVSPATAEYPIAHQEEQGTDHLLSIRHLWLRSKKQHAIMRVRNEVEKAIRDFYYERGFVLVDAPIFTPNACEGTTTLFEVKYFDEFAYLTQSGQLYMEAAAMAHGNVYCFGPVFRAERSKTRRHLTEFWMVEPEMAYASLDDVMRLAEDFVSYVVQRALERCQRELKDLERDTKPLESMKTPFPRISYDDAVKLLNEKGHKFEWGGDLGSPDETEISKSFDRPVMIHRYPAQVKAFYMRTDPASPKHALCVDVIAPEGVGEIIGGGERAIDLAFLEKKIEEEKLPRKAFEWYLDLRRFGSVPHAGFGLGLERTVQWISLQQRLSLSDEQLAAVLKEVVEVGSLDELDRMEASEIIDDLMRRAEEAGVDTSPQAGTATEKQVKFMKSLKRRAKLDDAAFEKIVEETAGVKKLEDVGKREASALIDKLLALSGGTPSKPPGERGAPPSRAPAPRSAPPARSKAPAPKRPAADAGAAPDERPPDRPDEGPADEDEDLPF
ncbi:asparagine--tRNA ligase [bacterium]|nr:asparagine--tRNA ligase [bacterium]